ncbi:sugar phosphate nucleotidyltransferase [Cohnella lubricantis]|uniref:Cupin domain-containing protein n=1 Tax=Cohnella lubricantis TaxID=2163172 RepID=A0A841T5P3_9BACL|nr:sugar phosphate nucleotidyltransferase [Cohnella lubricantis]MBB6676853.1 cupin domain-containing protein [Cohnella lubricantis]MBP2119433.1 mannose-1-phosphate guanylyltransferase [Cohnella lubricantis]
MQIVLLSGGSGRRLWPLSNDLRSKQFLPLIKNPEGITESMVQRVWRQLEEAGFGEGRYIATGKPQTELILHQLGTEAPIIEEPERRDTFPAIALAAVYLYSVVGVSVDEVITIMPVDPYVSAGFFETMKRLEEALRRTDAELALMGVVPTEPSEHLGYIVPDADSPSSPMNEYDVKCFKEKPRTEEAAALIDQGALWNCGVFAFKLGRIIDRLIDMNLPIQYEEMSKQYKRLPKISFDYAIVEKLDRIVVVPYEGEWRDLGTWESLTQEMDNAVSGKGFITDDCHNTHLINELEIPIAVIGLANAVVAASPDGILVSDKPASSRVKDLSAHWLQRPMFEERRWGSYKIVDFLQYPNGTEVLTKRILVKAGKNLSYQYHRMRTEVWTIIAGEGEVVINADYRTVSAGDVISIPGGTRHSIRAVTDIEFIEIQHGSELAEEDVVRIYRHWSEIISLAKQIQELG